MVGGVAGARLGGAHRGRRRPGRPPAPGIGDGRGRTTNPGRGGGRVCVGRPGRRGEPVLAAAQSPGRRRGGAGLRGAAGPFPSPRPAVAAPAPGPLPATARRPAVAPRDDQRAEPDRTGGASGHRGHDDLQRLRPRTCTRGPDAHARALGVDESEVLLLQPTRALERKNIAGALELTAAVGATYWLLGPAEDGYGPELDRLVTHARCRVLLGQPTGGCSIADAYAASDAVLLPSFWEGFGNPSVESATYRRAAGDRPVPGRRRARRLRVPLVRPGGPRGVGWVAGASRRGAAHAQPAVGGHALQPGRSAGPPGRCAHRDGISWAGVTSR